MNKNSKPNPFADCLFDGPVDTSEMHLVDKIDDLAIGVDFTFDFKEIPLTGEIVAIGANFKQPDGKCFNAIIVEVRGYKYLVTLTK